LAVSKQVAQRFDGETFNLRKLNELEVRKHYQVEITNRFAALQNLNDDEDLSRAWENIKENIKISAKERLGLHELKQRQPGNPGWLEIKCYISASGLY
jgi:50S ribosomal subunit-associated GTPase HflX